MTERRDSPARNVEWDRAARYYDAYVRATFDLPFFLDAAASAHGRVLELMCGTGRITLPLASAGHAITAVDSSRGLLARLASKLRRMRVDVEVVEADVRTLDLGCAFALVFVAFHAFGEILGRDDRARAFEAIRRHVAPGGRFLLALHNPPVRAAAAHDDWRSMGTFALGGTLGSRVEVSSRWEVDRAVQRVRGEQRYREFDSTGAQVREVTMPIVFDLVSPIEVEEHARNVGLRVRAVFGDYDRRAFDPVATPYAIFDLVPASRAAHEP